MKLRYFAWFLIFVLFSAAALAQKTQTPQPVVVTNGGATASTPVPVTGNINIANTPSVTVTGTPSVTGTVNIGNFPTTNSVTVDNTTANPVPTMLVDSNLGFQIAGGCSFKEDLTCSATMLPPWSQDYQGMVIEDVSGVCHMVNASARVFDVYFGSSVPLRMPVVSTTLLGTDPPVYTFGREARAYMPSLSTVEFTASGNQNVGYCAVAVVGHFVK